MGYMGVFSCCFYCCNLSILPSNFLWLFCSCGFQWHCSVGLGDCLWSLGLVGCPTKEL